MPRDESLWTISTNEVHRKGAEITDFTFPSETENLEKNCTTAYKKILRSTSSRLNYRKT